MNQYKLHLLDLPNEILFLILKQLNNIDVLYSLLGINNRRLDTIAQEQTFTNVLNFVSVFSTDNIASPSRSILDRFCIYILPRIHFNVKYLILESVSMERIFLDISFPNLSKLKLVNFNKEIVSHNFRDDSPFRHICKQQITDLILINNDNSIEITREEYTMSIYTNILIFFENLKHLTIVPSINDDYPHLSLYNLPSTIFFSSTLIELRIHVVNFNDCLALLDGRLKQLTTFIVQVVSIKNPSITSYNMDDLSNLKCFSFICYNETKSYDNQLVPLLHRMSYLEELSLYLCILNQPKFIDGTSLHNQILIHMSRLHTFNFYITSKKVVDDSTVRLFNNDIQQTFTNTRNQQVACLVDYVGLFDTICHVFSLPFKFDRLQNITNNFPDIVFKHVTDLKLRDNAPFKHEFFVRVARAFPSIKHLSVNNLRPPFWRFYKPVPMDNYSPIVEYPHLISLNISFVDIDYIDQFLNETKTHLPRLLNLEVRYEQLKMVTKLY